MRTPARGTTLITGGAGFIGSHVTEHLLSRGNRVVVLDDLSTGSLEHLPLGGAGDLEFVRGAVDDERVLTPLVARSDRVVHLAGAVGVRRLAAHPVEVIETNVLGTITVLRACARFRRPVLISSSSEVYGKAAGLPFSEGADVRLGPTSKPRWSYACAKAIGEYLALAYFRSAALPVVAVRLFNIAGPRQTGEHGMVIPRFVEQALRGRPLTVYGDGTQRRCFSHVSDVVWAIGRLLETPAAYGQVVNLGGHESITIRDLAERVRAMAHSRSEIAFVPFEEAYHAEFEDMADRRPDLSRARALIGYAPRRTLRDILASVIAYARDRERPAPVGVASPIG
jgi:UDP-glucose 4-epimerase